MTVQRIVVVVVSLLAIAWLGVSYANSQRIRHAQVVAADAKSTPAEIEATLKDLRADRPLDPSSDAEALSYQASLELRERHTDAALKLLDKIVRLEPDNAEAWYLIVKFGATSDPARWAEARAQLLRLNPMGTKESQ
jgi:type II secretory pathway component PulM